VPPLPCSKVKRGEEGLLPHSDLKRGGADGAAAAAFKRMRMWWGCCAALLLTAVFCTLLFLLIPLVVAHPGSFPLTPARCHSFPLVVVCRRPLSPFVVARCRLSTLVVTCPDSLSPVSVRCRQSLLAVPPLGLAHCRRSLLQVWPGWLSFLLACPHPRLVVLVRTRLVLPACVLAALVLIRTC
jgi:hypothetical protein